MPWRFEVRLLTNGVPQIPRPGISPLPRANTTWTSAHWAMAVEAISMSVPMDAAKFIAVRLSCVGCGELRSEITEVPRMKLKLSALVSCCCH